MRLLRNLSLLLCVYFLGRGVLCAQMEALEETTPLVRQILFVGNENFSRHKLQDLFKVRPGEAYTAGRLESGIDSILEAYQQLGYPLVTVTPQLMRLSESQVQIILVIDEGAPLHLGEFQIQGARRLSDEAIRRELKWREGRLIHKVPIDAGIQRVLRWYSEIGHPKAQIRLTNIRCRNELGQVDLTLDIEEGPQVRIGKIEVMGLQKTRPEVVLREIPLKPGEVYDQRRIDATVRRLKRLGFFYDIEPIVLSEGEDDRTVDFRARVTEARTGRFNGILGYAPPEGEREGARLTGLIEAQETNLLGTGRKLGLFWKSGLLSSYEANYEEPWIFGRRLHLGVAFSGIRQEDRSTQTTSRENAGSLSLRAGLTSWLEGTTSITYKRIQLPNNLGNGSKYGLTLALERDTRDSLINPTHGRRDRIAWENASGDFRMQKLWFELNQYWRTWPDQVIALGIHGARAWGARIPPTELFYLGGARTLRGYNEDWFRGPSRVYSNLEYRFLMGRASQLFLFLDTGSVSSIDAPGRLGNVHIGYGIGMRLESKAGAISLDYGIAQGTGALEGKIHVRVAPTF